MREEVTSDNMHRPTKYADQNQVPKPQNVKGNSHLLKPRLASSWGSHFVKGFTADKKTKPQNPAQSKKQPLTNNADVINQKNSLVVSHSRVKRSLIGDLSCSVNTSQVHPHVYPTHRRQSSTDLFNELDHMRSLLQESKERELKLQAELADYKRNRRGFDIEGEHGDGKCEIYEQMQKVALLEEEKTSLSEQLDAFKSILQNYEEASKTEDHGSSKQELELEVVELRRLNKELQLQKRNLSCKLCATECQLSSLAKASESEIVNKIKAEASLLRMKNEDLSKQVEGLQISRLNEVEELAYLRWMNSCLRNELRNSCPEVESDKSCSPNSVEGSYDSTGSFPSHGEHIDCGSVNRFELIKKLKKWPIDGDQLRQLQYSDGQLDKKWNASEGWRSPRRRHSISGSKYSEEEVALNKRRQSDCFVCAKENVKEPLSSQKAKVEPIERPQSYLGNQEANKHSTFSDVEKRALRIPNPPPRPSYSISGKPKEDGSAQPSHPPPPPPPPPPPNFASRGNAGGVQRAPQVVEFYHSLMKRDSRKDHSNAGTSDVPDVANVHSSMIGEIENRSSHLLAIKADVETQGEFVNSLIKEVNDAAYQNIEDVVAFVKWLDDELCFLVDERAVLKHFNWPEKKADTLREAAFGYQDLKKLESEVSSYKDDPRLPCDIALRKMVVLSEKMERTVYDLLRTRDSLTRNCKVYQIPTDWMLDGGIISKIQLSTVKLAKQHMKRVAMELQAKAGSEKDPALDYMLLQGVRFAFRIHQFAEGFDAETMYAFEELRNLASLLNKTQERGQSIDC